MFAGEEAGEPAVAVHDGEGAEVERFWSIIVGTRHEHVRRDVMGILDEAVDVALHPGTP